MSDADQAAAMVQAMITVQDKVKRMAKENDQLQSQLTALTKERDELIATLNAKRDEYRSLESHYNLTKADLTARNAELVRALNFVGDSIAHAYKHNWAAEPLRTLVYDCMEKISAALKANGGGNV